MKKWIIISCCLCIYYGIAAQSINRMEYFFDKDPGTGKGKPIAVIPADTIRINTPAMATTGLAEGVHALYIRARNDSGWGLTESFPLYIKANPNAPAVTNAEYFFDIDPGTGKGKVINVVSGDIVSAVPLIPSTGLTAGVHSLYVRARNADGWGLTESFPVYITSFANMPALASAEYFFDTDPGAGNGTVINIGSGADTVKLNVPLSSTGLAPGMHALYVRFKDKAGSFSHFESFPVYIMSVANMPKITAVEYFFEGQQDPGVGKAKQVIISPGADTAVKTINFFIPCLNADSTYNLYVRVKDEMGNWSHFETDSFKIRSANTVITAKSGLWSDASTWSNNVVPDSNTMIILNHDVIVDVNATCKYLFTLCHNVTVNAGKTLDVKGHL